MADSDGEYDAQNSDEDVEMSMNGVGGGRMSTRRAVASRPKGRAQAKWEAAASSNWELQAGADGSIEGALGELEEAAKRKR
jgi:transcription initiation factor TFIIH subunit 2